MPTIKTPHYKVEIDKDLADLDKKLHKMKASRVFVLVDENTKEHCLPIFHASITHGYEVLEVKSGEVHKTLESCTALWEELVSRKCDRSSVLINLGGGVIGDMGGFVAATYMRGIRFIQMPTTLLSQVDASVGGKLGVDFMGYKNIIGMFQDPDLVFIHTPFLQTLDNKELMSGFAEVIKHGLIQSKSLWETIKVKGTNLQPQEWTKVVTDSVKIKSKITSEDPKEAGIRKILNFGHTIGHAIESHYLDTDKHLLHGEAVAKGMIAESYLSFKTKRISIVEMEEINSLLESIYKLPTITPEEELAIMNRMLIDKKNKGGQKLFSLIKGIGNCDYDVVIDDQLIKESLSF